jgi:hypothetical protein
MTGRVKMLAVGEGDVMFGRIVLAALLYCRHKESLIGDKFYDEAGLRAR